MIYSLNMLIQLKEIKLLKVDPVSIQFNLLTGEVHFIWSSYREAEFHTGISVSNIGKALNTNATSGGFGWRNLSLLETPMGILP